MVSARDEQRQMQAMGLVMGVTVLLLVLLVALGGQQGKAWQEKEEEEDSSCKVWLVQSIPTDMPELERVPGVLSTADVLRWLAGNATDALDITAQYWELVAEPDNPLSGDYGFSAQQMEQFGAPAGQAVYASLLAAADRGVSIR
jgi:phospholipase D3/4